ncbi:MAG: aldose 1-epimerase [Alphaproteobacteria bacterium]|nr:aldose 1-epimerase [Alphaproteobacteria bacterium]
MPSEPYPLLACGPLSLQLSPGQGGSIARFDYDAGDGRKIPVFHGIAPGEGGLLDQGCFPLVPFVNRVRGGGFAFRGRAVRLAPNLPGEPSPLHGFGWTAPWDVEKHRDSETVLHFRHAPGAWPWAFHAAEHFTLDADGLTVTLACTNLSDAAMPCGLGLHPYFPCTAATVLDAEVASAWTIDARTLPVAQVAANGPYRLRERRICGAGLDNGFGGWSGRARLADPAWPFALTLTSPEARFLHVYAPAEGGFVALEPVTHANAALNEPEERWAELGLRILGPGETMRLTLRVDVSPL